MLLIVLLLVALPVAAQMKENAKDQEAIKSIAQQWQDTWNRHDMKATAALISEDVDFITVGGSWQKGRKMFEEYHAKLHVVQMKESVLTIKTTQVKFIKPDVALAHGEWGMKRDKNLDGTPRPPREGIMTWVLEKRKGNWIIIASHNTDLRFAVPTKQVGITIQWT